MTAASKATYKINHQIHQQSRKRWIHQSAGDKTFDIVVFLLVLLITICIFYPLYFVVIASFSDPGLVQSGQVLLWPKGLSSEGYKYIFKDNRIWTGYLNTFIYTVGGTLFALILTIPAGYALSNKSLKGRNIIMVFFLITMYFGGGMIPTYLIVKDMGLVDTYWVMILMGSFSVYNLIVTRTFFQSTLPPELYDAAQIDGCSIQRYFFSIVLPLSKPVVAIMALYYAVGHWNDFFNGLIYINSQELFPLQLILRDILLRGQAIQAQGVTDPAQLKLMQQISMTIKYGVIIVSSLPILLFYPFVQKYFVKGIMVGSLKG